PATYTGASSCLSSDGGCIPVGNANITSLMTNNLKGNFIAVEDINGSTIFQNSNTTVAAVPGEFSGTFSTGVYSLNGFPVNGTIPFFESVNNSHIKCNVPIKSGKAPDNAQPLLTRRALHTNKVETTLQWLETPLCMHYYIFLSMNYYTPPVVGSIEGDHNKFTVKNKLSDCAATPYSIYDLHQQDTGIIATEVSGNYNYLEHQGEILVFKTVNNDVPGNLAKIISGADNKLIQKGPFVINRRFNVGNIALTRGYQERSIKGDGILQLRVPVKGTNISQWGTVCDDGFSHQASSVACRQMGFNTGHKKNTQYEYSQYSLRPVLLSNIRCIGNETSLLQCPHNFTNEDNCTQPLVEIYCTGEKNYNNNTFLYAGVLSHSPEFTTNTPVAFLDKAGYIDFGQFPENNRIDTRKPQDWRAAQQHICASEKCDITCHYVNEQFHSVVRNGNKTYLVTRQRYPAVALFSFQTVMEREAKGLIRVTDISQPGANGTIRLYGPSADNPHLGAQNLSAYTPPVSKVVINNTLLSLHRSPVFVDYLGLEYLRPNKEAPGVQLSKISIDGTSSTYNSISYDFPGEDALLLNENAVFTYNETDHTIIQRSLNSDGQHYTIGEANVTYQLPPEPLIATGIDGNYMYVVTKEQTGGNFTATTNLIFSRYNLNNNEKDVGWNRSVQPNDLFEETGEYQLSFVDDEIQLLRRGELFSLDGVPYSLQIPQGGGCSEIHKEQALMVSVDKPVSQAMLQSELSSIPGLTSTSVLISTPTPTPTPTPTLALALTLTPTSALALTSTPTLTPMPTSSTSEHISKEVFAGTVIGSVIVVGTAMYVATVCKMSYDKKKRCRLHSDHNHTFIEDIDDTQGVTDKPENNAVKKQEFLETPV
ncbi:MAG: scavenger receptor cysteine-rich domain-containing protein, partial [Endozoicomonadaceae bacterium]|nr:scavenger receptor cysteine-rich domain-containing protein [Endozoicomonadaceae bacterium]